MARARTIKPAFFLNEELSEIPPEGRLLFIGLWTIADKEGRLEDRPKRIKAEIFPYEEYDVDQLLSLLDEHGFVKRYCRAAKRYVQITSFSRHQHPHPKEAESVIPPYDENAESLENTESREKVLSSREKVLPCREKDMSSPSYYLLPIMDTPIIDKPTPKKSAHKNCAEDFEIFWSEYPKHKGKESARKAFEKISPSKDLFSQMVNAIRKAKNSAEWKKDDGQYIPYPATWLNGHRWEDEDISSTPLSDTNFDYDPEAVNFGIEPPKEANEYGTTG